MISNIKYILKFVLRNDNGKFRFSYLFPVIGSVCGSYIIFMIFSIMNGMNIEIEDRINSFHYKHYYTANDFNNNNINNPKFNVGNTKIIYINDNNNIKLLNYFELFNLKKYTKDKLEKYLITDISDFNESDIIIGDNLSIDFNLNIGDSLEIYYPSDINISTQITPSETKRISGIFDIDLIDYDNNVIIGYLNNFNNSNKNFNYYFDKIDDSDKDYKDNMILSNLVIKGLKLEKKIYYFFGFLVIIISCFMLFQISVQFIKEKIIQLTLFLTLGLKKRKISWILLVYNLVFTLIMTMVGIVFTNLTIFMNINYNMFQFLYSALPFNVIYVSFLNKETFLIILVISLITIISSILPMLIIRKSNYVKF